MGDRVIVPPDTAESLFIEIAFILKSAPRGELEIRIGDQEIGEETQEKMNAIVSGFLGAESRVTEIAPPQSGRSRYGNQYRLTVNGERHISVKLAYGGAQEIRWEVFHAHMRNLLGLPHYKLERKNGFPIQDWKGMEYIIMDWGMAGRRRSVAELCVRADVRKSPASPFQFGQVVAQDILFAAGDRKRDHIVWDLDEKAMFSIDHEMPAEDMEEIVMFFRNELGYVWRKLAPRLQAPKRVQGRV